MKVQSACIVALTVLMTVGFVSGRWCIETVKKQHNERVLVQSMCNESYTQACGWFTDEQCTYYEMNPCPKWMNKTITRYVKVEVCCPGFALGPKNLTCRPIPGWTPPPASSRSPEAAESTHAATTTKIPATKASPIFKAISTQQATTTQTPKPKEVLKAVKNSNHAKSKNDKIHPISNSHVEALTSQATNERSSNERTVEVYSPVSINSSFKGANPSIGGQAAPHLYESDDSVLLGLSHGAYAGVVCFLAFLVCVALLVVLHARKRHIRAKARDPPQQLTEIDQSLLNNPQQV